MVPLCCVISIQRKCSMLISVRVPLAWNLHQVPVELLSWVLGRRGTWYYQTPPWTPCFFTLFSSFPAIPWQFPSQPFPRFPPSWSPGEIPHRFFCSLYSWCPSCHWTNKLSPAPVTPREQGMPRFTSRCAPKSLLFRSWATCKEQCVASSGLLEGSCTVRGTDRAQSPLLSIWPLTWGSEWLWGGHSPRPGPLICRAVNSIWRGRGSRTPAASTLWCLLFLSAAFWMRKVTARCHSSLFTVCFAAVMSTSSSCVCLQPCIRPRKGMLL